MLMTNFNNDFIKNNVLVNSIINFFNQIFYYVNYYFSVLYISDTNVFEETDYNYLLEFPENYEFKKENISNIDLDNKLVKTIKKFMEKNNLFENSKITLKQNLKIK